MEKRIIQVEEKVPVKLLIPLSIQHMFAMFGASVLGAFPFWHQPCDRTVHEWYRNPFIYRDHKGKSTRHTLGPVLLSGTCIYCDPEFWL